MTTPAQDLTERLQTAITAARIAREGERVAVLRAVLGAVQNAEAVPVDHAPVVRAGTSLPGAVDGLGAGDVSRRELSKDALRAVLDEELAERVAAAEHYRTLGVDDAAEHMDREAAVIADLVTELLPELT